VSSFDCSLLWPLPGVGNSSLLDSGAAPCQTLHTQILEAGVAFFKVLAADVKWPRASLISTDGSGKEVARLSGRV